MRARTRTAWREVGMGLIAVLALVGLAWLVLTLAAAGLLWALGRLT